MRALLKKFCCLSLALVLLASVIPAYAYDPFWPDEDQTGHLEPCFFMIYSVIKEPTCTEAGLEVASCSYGCSALDYQTIQPLGHDYEDGFCIRCGRASPEQCIHNYVDDICTHCGFANQINCNHTFHIKQIKYPTCTEMGVTVQQCTLCNYTTYETSLPLGHWTIYDPEVVTAPTCTEEGTGLATCDRCDLVRTVSLPATGHTYKYNYCIDCGKHNHSYKISWAEGTQCLQEGTRTLTCTGCNEVEEQIYSVTPHDFRSSNCSRCGQSKNSVYPVIYHLDGTCTVTDCISSGIIFALPEKINDFTVTVIGPEALIIPSEAHLTLPATIEVIQSDSLSGKQITFTGDAPKIAFDAIRSGDTGRTLIFPNDNPTYTPEYRDSVDFAAWRCSEHTLEQSVMLEATCQTYGVEQYRCTVCNYLEYQNTDPLGHSYVDGSCTNCGQACSHDFAKGVWVYQPTCTVAGRKSYTCNLCGYVKYATFSATGHSFVEGVCTDCNFTAPDHDYVDNICIDCGRPLPEDVQPCVTHHFNRCVCTFCGTRCPYFDKHLEGGDDPCPVCGYRDRGYSVFDECDHMNRFGTWITKPTCTNMGKVRLDCNRCVDYRTVLVPAHGHEFVEDVCIYCNLSDSTVCQHSYVDGSCTTCGQACSHDFAKGVWVTMNTCTEDGRKSYTCNTCGYVKYARFPATGHSFVDGTCTTCGQVCSHDFAPGVWVTRNSCTKDGLKDYTCNTCGYIKHVTVPATGHDYQYGVCNNCHKACEEHSFQVAFFTPPMPDLGFDGTMRRVCTICDYTDLVQVPYDEHNFGEPLTYSPTCTQDGHCDYACIDCDYVISVILYATGHDYDSGVCVSCGEVCSHNYENGACTICDKACAHIFRAESPISCTEGGEVMHVCEVCGITQLLYIPPNSHNYKNGVCIYCGEAEPNCAQLTGTMLLPCENVKVWLFVCGEDTPAYTAQISGEQYCFTGVTPGGYTLKVSCDGGVPREYAVTLTAGENTQDVTLSRPGDVDGDHDLTILDVSMVYAHVRGTQLLEGYGLQCADLNGDGQVDIVDTAIAYSRVKG